MTHVLRKPSLAITAFAIAVLACFALASTASAKVVKKSIGKFASPTYVTQAPGVPGVLVVEQGGRVISVQGKRRRPFLNIDEPGPVRRGAGAALGRLP